MTTACRRKSFGGEHQSSLTPLLAIPGEGTRRGAFTLVELLVVIGIIAVLIGILLPTLGRANELAKRTACSSNLREIYLSLRFYANDNRDVVLVGYRKNRMYNSTVWSNTANPPNGSYTLFGWLYPAGYMKNGRIWFCPSEASPKYMYNLPLDNPWPPGPPRNGAILTNAGYGGRPAWELLDSGPGVFKLADESQRPFTRLSKWPATSALLADLMNGRSKLSTRHKRGVNAAYGDGHVAWVGQERFDLLANALPAEPFLSAASPEGIPLAAAEQTVLEIWNRFDVR